MSDNTRNLLVDAKTLAELTRGFSTEGLSVFVGDGGIVQVTAEEFADLLEADGKFEEVHGIRVSEKNVVFTLPDGECVAAGDKLVWVQDQRRGTLLSPKAVLVDLLASRKLT